MEFDNVILQTAENIKRTLQFIPDDIKQQCEEIRIRKNLPVCLTVGGKTLFVCQNSKLCNTLPKNPIIATNDDVQKSLALLCNNSIYLHENEIKQGFVSLKNGCRAGVCGVFNADGMLISVSSINIRIARQIFNCARFLLPYTTGGLLITGPPGSGKTTILRDLSRLLSNGENGTYQCVAIIDSRGEISGGDTLDIGVNTDVVQTHNKGIGVDIALRTMCPDYIVFDEIGTLDELNAVMHCFNAGVNVITTAHCSNEKDVFCREVTRQIIKKGAISNVALLSSKIGDKAKILTSLEIKNSVYN